MTKAQMIQVDATQTTKAQNALLNRMFWALLILVWIETLRLAYAVGYDYLAYWGYLA